MNDATICPLCGGPNECGMISDTSPCWCYGATISREVLERVPVEAQGLVCVCRTCATGTDWVRAPAESTPA